MVEGAIEQNPGTEPAHQLMYMRVCSIYISWYKNGILEHAIKQNGFIHLCASGTEISRHFQMRFSRRRSRASVRPTPSSRRCVRLSMRAARADS
jgi:hypothetical protein